MANIRAFKAVRPKNELVKQVAALPYDVMDSDEASEMVKDNPYSFLHIDKAEIDLEQGINLYDTRVYEKANDNLQRFISEGVLVEDDKPHLYIYRQIMKGRAQTGIVACAFIEDYINNVIKKHEHTKVDKEIDRINHVNYCDANTGPIFLTYRNNESINRIIDAYIKNEPVYNFVSEDGTVQIVWSIEEEDIIVELINLFGGIDNLYIADGHHRAKSAIEVGKMRRQQNPGYTGEEEFNYFLCVMFPDKDLYIMDYNRVVKDLNGLSTYEYIQKVSESFEVCKYDGNDPYRPSSKHTYGMYVDGQWYKLSAKDGVYDPEDPVHSLDVAILQDKLLGPILDIKDPRTDERIDFIGGMRGLKELERRVEHGMKVAFAMYPPTVGDLMTVADNGEVMPPKSTWFEPKLRSGLFIHKLR